LDYKERCRIAYYLGNSPPKSEKCDKCKGSGADKNDVKCDFCGGSGTY
jgi:DnaJ-class molecular chaperone